MSLIPRQPVPDLTVETLGNGQWSLSSQNPENFTMIAFYRGLHCPLCKKSLADLNRKAADFEKAGISVFAVSCDSEERAARTKSEWELENVEIGYGLSIEKAREWGLYISTSNGVTSMGVEEPAGRAALLAGEGAAGIPAGAAEDAALRQLDRVGREEIREALDRLLAGEGPSVGLVEGSGPVPPRSP